MSNKFNKQNQILKKPKICKPPPPPPPKKITCAIIPNVMTVEEESTITPDIIANNPDLPRDDQVAVEYFTTGPNFDGSDDIQIDDLTEVEVEGDVGGGIYTITAVFTFSDSTKCSASAEVTVTVQS